MATTPELVEALAANLRPVRRGQVERRLAVGVGLGVAVSAVVMLAKLGMRPDLAGAAGALVYSFHCDEFAVPFLAIWYTLGIALAGGLGAGAAKLVLRW